MALVNVKDKEIQLYTVPGQVKYNATRKLVLRGADGIVFVADLLTVIRKQNMQSLRNLNENLKGDGRSILKIPLVLQYNKADLAEQKIPLLSFKEIDNDLNRQLKARAFKASAIQGGNILNTFSEIVKLSLLSARKTIKKKMVE